MIGKSLGHYAIKEKLGSGGMGDVYVAEDAKLGRDVALKVLPPAMARHPERRLRFEREAKAVATLNHPNIVTIHSVEEDEGVHFITMELVRGKTLTEIIAKGGLPLNLFFEIAIPMADAVSAAHQDGIIHRDLKPDNIMVSDEGRPKVLDFGLAKLKQEISGAGRSELPTKSMTEERKIVGTVSCMSPEQAEGKPIDHRSDIFSLGTVLYEMASGRRPFQGESSVSILSSIIKDTPPPVTELKPELPRDLGKLIRRCLEKDPEHRLQTAKDLRNELGELKREVDSGEALHIRPSSRRKWPLVAAFVAVAAVATLANYLLTRSSREPAPVAGTLTQLTSQPGPERYPCLSPDGENVIYVSWETGNGDIDLKRVGGERVINLTEDSPADDTQPAYSPDGEQIAFRSEREGGGIFLMGATGESVTRLTDFGYNPTWSPDGKEIAGATESVDFDAGARFSKSQLWIVNVANREKRLLTDGDAVQPSWSPNGSRIAYWSAIGTGRRDIWTVSANGDDAVPVTDDVHVDWNPVWSPDGRYLYFSSDRGGSMNLWRVRIDEASGKVLGTPESVTTGASADRQHLSFDRDGGRIAYVEQVTSINIWQVGFDPTSSTVQGDPTPLIPGSMQMAGPSVSPDGQWLAFRSSGKQEDILVTRTDGTSRRQLTNDLYWDRLPKWSPDGEKIAFFSNRSGRTGIWTIRPDGSGLQQLAEAPDKLLGNPVWSPDGRRMSCYDFLGHTSYLFDPDTPWQEQTPESLPPLSDDGESFHALSWSRDGHWLVGRAETVSGGLAGVAIYSLESHQYRKLTDFGWFPEWLPDSQSVLFASLSGLHMVDKESGDVREVLSIPPDFILNATVSHDLQRLYFTRIKWNADIWLLELN